MNAVAALTQLKELQLWLSHRPAVITDLSPLSSLSSLCSLVMFTHQWRDMCQLLPLLTSCKCLNLSHKGNEQSYRPSSEDTLALIQSIRPSVEELTIGWLLQREGVQLIQSHFPILHTLVIDWSEETLDILPSMRLRSMDLFWLNQKFDRLSLRHFIPYLTIPHTTLSSTLMELTIGSECTITLKNKVAVRLMKSLTSLRSLTLMGMIMRGLRFLAESPSLTSLRLQYCMDLNDSDLMELRVLTHLQTLELSHTVSLQALSLHALIPPSTFLPSLTTFIYNPAEH